MDPTELNNLRQLLDNKGWRLHFPKVLETEFQEHYAQRYHSHMIISGLLGILAILGTGIVDPFWMPQVAGELWEIRAWTTGPILLLLLFSRTSIATRFMQPIIAFSANIFVGGLVALSLTASEPINHYYAASITMVMLVVFVLSRLQFGWGVLSASFMLLTMNMGFGFIGNASMQMLIVHNALFFISAMFSLLGCFLFERSLRQNYLQSRLLNFEKHDLEESNLRLQYLTAIDGLTQIANRRSLDVSLVTEWQRALRKREPIGLIMIDVDHFKLFNDTYGHQAGDECLRGVASALKDFARRPGDLAARYGGEEFVLVLTNATAQQARMVAERVRDKIVELAIPHQRSSHGNVTASFGVASLVPNARHNGPEALLLAADQALYRAKESGRNRVSVDGEPKSGQAVA